MITIKQKIAVLILSGAIMLNGSLQSAFSQTLPSGYIHQKVTSTELPTALSFTPDGRPIVCSSVGGKGIALIVNNEGTTTPFLTIPKTFTNNEKGLLGLTFDPDFAANGYVYIYYTADLSANVDQSSTCQNTIARITAINYIADLSTLIPLLKLYVNPKFIIQPNHDGGALRFGPDGKLYVASGDLDLWCSNQCISGPNAGGCACGRTWISPTYSQDTSLYNGKILRINKDGSAPKDNPFYKEGSTDARNYLFALGVRNPYTMHFKKGTSQLWINDVGSSGINKREEINMIDVSNPSSKVGKNLGFNNGTSQPTDGTPPSTEGFFNANDDPAYKTFTQPIQVYLPSEGCAISGGTFYEPTTPSFDSQYVGKYFYMDFCQGWIKYMDADGKNINTFATGLAGGGQGFGSVSIEDAPDGNMYHLVRSSKAGVSGLYRIKGPIATGTDASLRENKYAFSIHPNPAKNVLNVHFNGLYSEQGVITVYDMMGKVQTTFAVLAKPGFNDENYDISQLPRGIYNVNFSTPNAKASKKLVVE